MSYEDEEYSYYISKPKKKSERKERFCMTCAKSFISSGKENRMCRKCRKGCESDYANEGSCGRQIEGRRY